MMRMMVDLRLLVIPKFKQSTKDDIERDFEGIKNRASLNSQSLLTLN
jgi:hypothetical protein